MDSPPPAMSPLLSLTMMSKNRASHWHPSTGCLLIVNVYAYIHNKGALPRSGMKFKSSRLRAESRQTLPLEKSDTPLSFSITHG